MAPLVDVLTAGFTQYSEADCNLLMDRMKRHLEDLEDARGSEVLIDIDTDIENDPSLSCGNASAAKMDESALGPWVSVVRKSGRSKKVLFISLMLF